MEIYFYAYNKLHDSNEIELVLSKRDHTLSINFYFYQIKIE